MAEEFRRLWETLKRHPRARPASYRLPYWYKRVEELRRIDEVIEIADENDRYGEPNIVEEADADGPWMLHVAAHHELCREIARARCPVCHLGAQIGVSPRKPQSENLALGTAHNAVADTDADADKTFDFVHSQSHETAQPEGSSSSPESGAHLSGPQARTESSANRRSLSRDIPNGHSDVADRNKENHKRSQSLFDTDDSGTLESDSSDDEDMSVDADDAEQERIFQLFEDFPTLIQKARHLPAIDSGDHGIMIISNPESGWSHIQPARLPPRIRKYLAEFTTLEAVAFPDGVYPDLALNGPGSRRWLLATARKEFICDTSTLDVWYRFLDHTQQSQPPKQPL
ncbi:hypothetical protein SLS64_001973 [Diaporthe eres]|uniref:Ankyrin repeat protein n=1 Tax=Diaporthe eres TaxID=83184 RepID=A0ABR1PNJ7_DIAER